MSSTIDFSAGQLAAARATAWHQDGKALLTLEGARSWVDHFGLVLFAPRAQQLGAPAASFIEATLGVANEAPSAADSATARSLAARLVAEGSALPLNLLGSAGDQPDFLASAKVFSYVFTMRGDKAWKQPPSTHEGAKVSPLAVRVWEVLVEKGAMSAAELVSELGREVTETAILRALNELWSQLRVIPQVQQDTAQPTLWELTSKRFAKAIKAGTNAGQPTAMSALLSLYLSQAIGATEEEAAGFLSPLTARSRVREVLHALTAGRQLDTTVVEGKTLLHVSGSLPEFAELPKPELEAGAVPEVPKAAKVGTGRIGKFAGGTDFKPRSDFKGKPAFGASSRGSAAPRSSSPRRTSSATSGPRPSRPAGARPDTERRPFKRDDSKPTFTRPWEEDKRPQRESSEAGAESATPRERKPYERKTFADKPAYGAKKTYGDKPAYGAKKPYERKSFSDKPAFGANKPYERKSFGDKPAYGAKKTYGDRPSFADRPTRPARPRRDEGSGSSEGFAPRERSSFPPRDSGPPRERKSFGARPGSSARPSFGDRPARPRRESSPEGFAPRERPSYPPREGGARSYERKPFGERKPFTPREGGSDRPRRTFDKPASDAPRSFDKPRSSGARPGGFSKFSKPDGDRKPFRPRAEGDAPRSYSKPAYDRPARPRSDGDSRPARPGGFGSKPPFGSKPAFGAKPRFGATKPGAKFAGKPGAASKFGAKPARPYAKRAPGSAPTRRKPESEE